MQKPVAATLRLHETLQAGQVYDMILVADIFDGSAVMESLETLDFLTSKAQKQVLAVIPQRCESTSWGPSTGIQEYHPTLFCEFDFTYLLLGREHENKIQLYSFLGGRKKSPYTLKPSTNTAPILPPKKPLSLAYILPDQDLTGGIKQLLLQAKAMHHRGHLVSVYTKSDTATNALPPWSDVTENDISSQHVLKSTDDFASCIGSADVIILGWMEQVPEFRHTKIPLVLWEQGSRLLFGDFGTPQSSTSKERMLFRSYYRLPLHILAVSPLVQKIAYARFGKKTRLVCAAVDNNSSPVPKQNNPTKKILLVGDAEKDHKNFTFVIQALELAAQQGAIFEVHWATPTAPLRDIVPKGLHIEYHITTEQAAMDALYQSSDLLLSHSLYEAFSLPPLEAMAAGTAVLAVNNGGIETYAVSQKNCILCQQGDLAGYAKEIGALLKDDALRERLGKAGLTTAKEFSVASMCSRLETSLYAVIQKSRDSVADL